MSSSFDSSQGKIAKPLSTLDYIARLQEGFLPCPLALTPHMQYGDELKQVIAHIDHHQFPEKIEIYHITDVHFGHVLCKEQKIKEYVDWILAEPYRFVLFGGDNVDAATQLSIASTYENKFAPSDQMLQFCQLFMPLRHRILGYVSGNHERRSVKGFGDLGQMIATLLQIPYSRGVQFIDIRYGDHKPFAISMWHGTGGARTAGAKMQMLARFMEQGDSQLYLVGHLHDAMVKYSWRVRRRPEGGIKLVKIAGAMSSSFMEYFGTYAETAGLQPSDVMMWRCILTPNGKWELTSR